MADSSNGPVRTLPGSFHKFPVGTTCDHHPDRVAYRRVQTETDSMGCEYADLCEECLSKALVNMRQFFTGQCERCQNFKDSLRKWRDPEEGSAGRVYNACQECVDDARRYARDEAKTLLPSEATDEVAGLIREVDPSFDPDDPDFDPVYGELPQDTDEDEDEA